MESEAQKDANSTSLSSSSSTIPTLQLFSFPPQKSPQHSGNLTSPLHTSASVPFSWEEHPGKPLPCLTLALPSNNNTATTKCLDLPPRLLNESKFTKTPSPTTVLEGPYSTAISGKSSSFRFLRKRQGSFDFEGSFGNSPDPDRGLLGTIILSRSSSSSSFRRDSNKGLFGSWRKRGGVPFNNKGSKNDVHGGNFVFSSVLSDDGASIASCDGGGSTVKASRRGWKASFLGLSPIKSHFWAAIYGALKQVIRSPRSTKWKKESDKSVKTSLSFGSSKSPSLCSTASL